MKTAYFTENTIDSKAAALLDNVRSRVRQRDIHLNPDESALIVLDMQRYFGDAAYHAYIPSLPAIVPKIKELEAAFAAKGRPVFLTRHSNTEEDAGLMGSWWEDLIRDGTTQGEILPDLRTDGAMVLDKTQYDAFYGTDLEDLLRGRGTSQIVVTGVMTHLCCETTARSAFVRGFTVFLPVDCTATYNEDFHSAALLNLAHGFAVPVLARDLLKSLGAG